MHTVLHTCIHTYKCVGVCCVSVYTHTYIHAFVCVCSLHQTNGSNDAEDIEDDEEDPSIVCLPSHPPVRRQDDGTPSFNTTTIVAFIADCVIADVIYEY